MEGCRSTALRRRAPRLTPRQVAGRLNVGTVGVHRSCHIPDRSAWSEDPPDVGTQVRCYFRRSLLEQALHEI